jgi:phosphohistidine phosphatase SixA
MICPSLSRVFGLPLLASTIVANSLSLAAAENQNQIRAREFPVVIAVRHAEAAIEDDPPLIEAGAARARELAAALRDAGVSAIITSEFRRTRETAAPLASALGLQPQVVSGQSSFSEHIEALGQTVRGYAGGVVLVVGHSDTVPALIAALGGPKMPQICDAVFDELFTLFRWNGKVHFIHARYGAASPHSAPECR